MPATSSRCVPRHGAENHAARPTITAHLSANQAQTAWPAVSAPGA